MQHLLDTHKASQQLTFARGVGIRQIKAAAEILAGTAQHQQPCAVVGTLLQRLQQCFGQADIQRVGARGPVQRELAKAVLLLHQQRCG